MCICTGFKNFKKTMFNNTCLEEAIIIKLITEYVDKEKSAWQEV